MSKKSFFKIFFVKRRDFVMSSVPLLRIKVFSVKVGFLRIISRWETFLRTLKGLLKIGVLKKYRPIEVLVSIEDLQSSARQKS